MKQHHEHNLLLRWFILTGLIIFALTVAWNEGIIYALFSVDQSNICWVIALTYLLVTLHCAKRIYMLSSQANLSMQVNDIIKNEVKLDLTIRDEKVIIDSNVKLPDCFMSEYIRDLHYRYNNKNSAEDLISSTDLIEVYESRLKGPQEIGWFVSDMMLKLGLLGTIVGFIFMLGSVANIADFDVSGMQKILKHMSNGMGTALYTTLAGLTCSLLSATQYHMLDRHADELIELTRHLTQVHIIPKISGN
jgi:flagellar motor component MotA